MKPYGILSNFKQFLDSLRGRGMRYIFHGTQDEWDALTAAEKDRYDQAELSGGTDNSCPIYVSQEIADGDLNPVSSDAVYHKLSNTQTGVCTINQAAISAPNNSLIKRNGIAQLHLRLLHEGQIIMQSNIATIPEGFRPLQAFDVLSNCWTNTLYNFQFRLWPDGRIVCLNGDLPTLEANPRIDVYISATYLTEA